MKQNKNHAATCPNCWGYQEYEGKKIPTVLRKCIGWIQEYAKKYLS